MEMRQNVYFILMYSVVMAILVLSSIFLYVKVRDMNKEISLYKSIYDVIQKSLNIYYSGARNTYNNGMLSAHECFSRYDSYMRINAYCDGKKLVLFSLNYPLLMNIHKGNSQIYVDRGEIDYSVFKYLYVVVTNKRVAFIRFDISNEMLNKDEFKKFLSSFFLNLPTSTVVGFYDSNKYILECKSQEMDECDKDDFIYFLVFHKDDVGKYISGLGINLNTNFNEYAIEKLQKEYFAYDPIFIDITNDENNCGVGEECIVYIGGSELAKYVFKNPDGTKVERKLKDAYDLLLLIFFKQMYGYYYPKQRYFEINNNIYRGMWLDYVAFYSKILSGRYELLKEKKHYDYESYEVCRGYFNTISQDFCNTSGSRSICEIYSSNKNHDDKIKDIYDVLQDIIRVGNNIISKGCEEMVFL